MYHNDTANKFSREIALEKVSLQLNTSQEKLHYFEMRTDQNIYYCGYKRTRNRVRFAGPNSGDLDGRAHVEIRYLAFLTTSEERVHADSASPARLQHRGS